MNNILLTAAETDTTLIAALTAIGGSLVTIVTGYFQYKTQVAKAKREANEKLEEKAAAKEKELIEEASKTRKLREDDFDAQLKRQEESHKEMLKTQEKAFQKQLDALRREKVELLDKINTLEETVEQKIEQIIDLATQNSRREGMLEVLKNGESES